MSEFKNCPYCGEEIKINAKKCKHCKTFLDNDFSNQSDTIKPDKSGKKNLVAVIACASLLLVLIIISIAVAIPIIETKKADEISYNSYIIALKATNGESDKLLRIQNQQKITKDYLTANQKSSLKSKAFYEYRKEIYKTIEDLDGVLSEMDMLPLVEALVRKEFSSTGLKLMDTYGAVYYVSEDNQFALDNFAYLLDESWQEFFNLRKTENNKFFSDGCSGIPKEEIRRRIMVWEAFIRKYPKFIANDDIKVKLAAYASTYISDKYDFEYRESSLGLSTAKIQPEILVSYENFLKENKDSKYYPAIKKWVELLHEGEYVSTEKLDTFTYKEPYPVKNPETALFDFYNP